MTLKIGPSVAYSQLVQLLDSKELTARVPSMIIPDADRR